MDGEALRFVGDLLRQGYLGIDLLTLPPGGGEALEGGAVTAADLFEAVIEVVEEERLGILGGPDLERLGGGCGSLGKGPARILDPLPLLALEAGVDRDLALPFPARPADHDLQRDRSGFGKNQGSQHGELLDGLDTGLLCGLQRQLEEGGGRQRDGAADGVVRQPGVGGQRKAAGEGEALAFGILDRRAEQRMPGVAEAGSTDIAGADRGCEPVALPLEGIGRQRNALGPRSLEEGMPIDRHAGGISLGEGEGKALGSTLFAAQGEEQCCLAWIGQSVVDRLLGAEGEDRVWSDLDQGSSAAVEE